MFSFLWSKPLPNDVLNEREANYSEAITYLFRNLGNSYFMKKNLDDNYFITPFGKLSYDKNVKIVLKNQHRAQKLSAMPFLIAENCILDRLHPSYVKAFECAVNAPSHPWLKSVKDLRTVAPKEMGKTFYETEYGFIDVQHVKDYDEFEVLS